MNVGSLFSGIEGFGLGFERAGMRVVWQVEQDAYCRAVLAQHFPDAERFEDVRDVGAHCLQPVDLICGGFPCQDLSVAGRGAGIDGARSGLWAEFARIIGELRPRYVVVENVPALTRNEWLGRVLGDLASCGYDAEWDCLPASAFGAPHRRDRIWLVAYPGGEGRRQEAGGSHGDEGPHERGAAEVDHLASGPGASGLRAAGVREHRGALADAEGNGRRSRRSGGSPSDSEDGARVAAQGMGDAYRASKDALAATGAPRQGAGESGWWATEPDVGRVADGVPSRVDRLAALGNALVPQIAEWIGRRILDYEEGGLT